MRLILPLVLILFTVVTLPLFAQGDTVTRNPKAVQLKRIWTLEGRVLDAEVGTGVGGIGDINGDGFSDFAVLSLIPWQWRVFYGSSTEILTTPVWTFDSATPEPNHPIVGNFYGTGHNVVGFMFRRFVGSTGVAQRWLHLFRSDSNHLHAAPSLIWHLVDWKDTTKRAIPGDILATDLDGDGDDEMIVVVTYVDGQARNGQLWIYEGGPNFQVDTPSMVIRDPELNDGFFLAHAGDIDGDRRIDLMTVKSAPGVVTANFYWGSNGWPVSGRQPDRVAVTGNPQERDGAGYAALADCDGDGVMDVVTPVARIWRSGSGKNPHTREWTIPDADIYLRSAGGPFSPGGRPGYLNSKRYEMVSPKWSPGALYFSGGPNGPDSRYDAMYYPGNDGLQGRIGDQSPAGDVNGDGWDDAISGNYAYPSDRFDYGIAVILAGGPYIPSDDPSVSVRQLPLENKPNALSLWPNPVRSELNIAWRGDLQRMPRRFEVHDMLGRLVASGSVPDGDGAALWQCGSVTAGAYMIGVFDGNGERLASERVVKE